MEIIKPKRIRLGQTIGVIAPSSPPRKDEEIADWLDRIRELGFRVKQGPHLHDRYGFLAGSDEDRAEDINRAFGDEQIDAIICLRSGMGSARTLPYLDFDLIRANPKVIVGFSDLTALINAIHARTGLVTFHGPEAEDQIVNHPYSLAEFQKVVMDGISNVQLATNPDRLDQDAVHPAQEVLVRYMPGKARGQLIGGNLPTLAALTGTPFEPDYHGKLLFLESFGEDTYKQCMYLNQLWLAGKLEQVSGVIFGQFLETEEILFTLHEVLAERFISLKIPAIYGLAIGHLDEQATIPIGCEAELDADAGTLTLLESAVTDPGKPIPGSLSA
jgi:muramoyltetrapeptide carboxypeptidase